MDGYLVCTRSSYLQHHPYDDSYGFTAGNSTPEHAAVFTRQAAMVLAKHYREVVGIQAYAWPDVCRPARQARVDVDAIQHLIQAVA